MESGKDIAHTTKRYEGEFNHGTPVGRFVLRHRGHVREK